MPVWKVAFQLVLILVLRISYDDIQISVELSMTNMEFRYIHGRKVNTKYQKDFLTDLALA